LFFDHRSLITGLQYPRFAASAVGVFTFGKILYTLGYSTGHPMKVRHDLRLELPSLNDVLVQRLSWGGLLGSVTQAGKYVHFTSSNTMLMLSSFNSSLGWFPDYRHWVDPRVLALNCSEHFYRTKVAEMTLVPNKIDLEFDVSHTYLIRRWFPPGHKGGHYAVECE
jgi:hypothetical protein